MSRLMSTPLTASGRALTDLIVTIE